MIESAPGQLLLVVTPGSEPGGRWFDSNPRNLEESQTWKSSGLDEEPVLKTGVRRGGLWVRVPRLPPRLNHGLIVQQEDAGLACRKSGRNSR
jgi:hypothetical protein